MSVIDKERTKANAAFDERVEAEAKKAIKKMTGQSVLWQGRPMKIKGSMPLKKIMESIPISPLPCKMPQGSRAQDHLPI